MRRVALLAAVLCLRAAGAGADVADFLDRPIVSVRLELEGREVADAKLLDIIETRAGMPLSMAEVRETVTRLFSLGRYEDVRVRADSASNGVTLLYDLVPLHPIDRIAFSGPKGPGIDVGRLRSDVVERYGTSPPLGRAADLARIVEDDLRARGYLHPVVTPRADVRHRPDRTTLTFAIDPGPRSRIGGVDVVGSSGLSPAALLKLLGVSTGAPYESDRLDERVARYIDDRRSKGYFEAKLVPTTRLSDEDRVVHLTLTASQGPHVRVVFEGDPLPSDRRNELVPIEREGSTDEDLLEDSSNRIEEYLREQGYRDASAPHARQESEGELLIAFTVKKGPQYRVASVEISGNATLPLADLQPGLRVRAGQAFSEAGLDGDVSAIADLYHRRGFPAVIVEPDLEAAPSEGDGTVIPVVVRIGIVENARAIVGSVRIQGNALVPEGELTPGLGLQPGAPFFATQMALDRDSIEIRYANLGFQTATVGTAPGLSRDGSRADIVFTVNEGPRLFIDHILIVGNVRTKTETIERELQFRPGDPLGLSAVTETRRRLFELGLFRRTDITAIGHDEGTRDILVSLDEGPVTTVGYGVGVQGVERIRTSGSAGVAEQRLEFAPRAFFEIGRSNLFGKNRSLNLFTRLSLRPRGAESSSDPAVTATDTGGQFGFAEYRILGTFREPRVLGTQADSVLTGTLEQQVRSSFNFARRALSAEVGRRLTTAVSASGSYQIQRIELFDEKINAPDKLLIDRIFPEVRLSSFSTSVIRNTRDDALDPSAGVYLSGFGQLAGRTIGSEVGLAKTFLTGQLFRTLPHVRRVVLATSLRLGVAAGFARRVVSTGEDGQPIEGVVKDLPASERFFAGGDTTVRGFALDQLGTPKTIDTDGFPIGGNAVVILNAELRAPYRNLQFVGFLDAGNVFAKPSEIDLGQMRSAVGFGIRYKSPVGPIRVDVGFKVHRHDIVPGKPESPAAVHISLGQAF